MLDRAGFCMRQRGHVVPGAQMHVTPEVITGLHHAGRYSYGLEQAHDLVRQAFPGPGADQRIQLIMPLPALGGCGETRFVHQSSAANSLR